MNNGQVPINLYNIIGRQTAEIEFLKGQIQQLQAMLEQMKKSADEVKNGAGPDVIMAKVEPIPT